MAAYRIIIHASQSAQLFLACAEARNVTCHSVNRLTSCYGFYRDCMKVSPVRRLRRKNRCSFLFRIFNLEVPNNNQAKQFAEIPAGSFQRDSP